MAAVVSRPAFRGAFFFLHLGTRRICRGAPPGDASVASVPGSSPFVWGACRLLSAASLSASFCCVVASNTAFERVTMQVARSHIIVLVRLTFAAHIVAMNFLLRAKSADSTIADSLCTTVTSKIDFFF